MPKIISKRKLSDVVKRAKDRLASNAGIRNFDGDSVSEAMLSSVLAEINEIRADYAAVARSYSVTEASFDQLKEMGLKLGVIYKTATKSKVDRFDSNLKIYVSSGTFGDLNNDEDIEVAAGALFSTTPNENNRSAVKSYRLTESVVLPAAGNTVYVSAESVDVGTKFNIGSGMIVSHNISQFPTLKVTNRFPIATARDNQSIENYRYEISKQGEILSRYNQSAISVSALGISGVEETKIIPGYYGIGTTALIVMGPDFVTSDSLLDLVRGAVSSQRAPSQELFVLAPVEWNFVFDVTVKPKRKLSSSDKQSLEFQMSRLIKKYFSEEVRIGGIVDLGNMTRKIQKATGQIVTFSDVSEAATFRATLIKTIRDESYPIQENVRSSVIRLDEDAVAKLQSLTVRYSE